MKRQQLYTRLAKLKEQDDKSTKKEVEEQEDVDDESKETEETPLEEALRELSEEEDTAEAQTDVIALDTKSTSKKRKRDEQNQKKDDSAVIYLGRIPHGFYEDEMRKYFSQFGEVKNLRLSRNKRGASRHYGFIEFESPSVTRIVVETMHNYLLFGHRLKCIIVPTAKVHPQLWKGANRKFRVIPVHKVNAARHNKDKTPEEVEMNVSRLAAKEEKKRKALADAGIEYDFPGIGPQAKKIKAAEKETPKQIEAPKPTTTNTNTTITQKNEKKGKKETQQTPAAAPAPTPSIPTTETKTKKQGEKTQQKETEKPQQQQAKKVEKETPKKSTEKKQEQSAPATQTPTQQQQQSKKAKKETVSEKPTTQKPKEEKKVVQESTETSSKKRKTK